jgi:uncharacterized protein (DUF342 family)
LLQKFNSTVSSSATINNNQSMKSITKMPIKNKLQIKSNKIKHKKHTDEKKVEEFCIELEKGIEKSVTSLATLKELLLTLSNPIFCL